MLNYFDWFVNQVAGSPWMALLLMEMLYSGILMLGKTSYHSMSMIIMLTLSIWLTTLFGPVWFALSMIVAVVYFWYQTANFINRE